MGFPSADTPSTPAKRPERVVEVDPEDIELGTSDASQGADLKTKGKRSLTRPTGSSPASGAQI